MTTHYDPHFVNEGFCNCNCEDCHTRLSGACVCPDCVCDNPFDDAHYDPDNALEKVLFGATALAIITTLVQPRSRTADVIKATIDNVDGAIRALNNDAPSPP